MDKKITQRIIGVFVLIALVVIIMPLFFSKNESTEVASVSSTPSADKPIEIKQAESATPDAAQTSPQPAAKLSENTTPTVNPTITPVPDNQDKTITPVAADQLQKLASNQSDAAAPATTTPQLPLQQDTQTLPVEEKVATADNASETLKQTTDTSKPAVSKKVVAQALGTGSKKPTKDLNKQWHKTAWVVQMGSFKNKDNARRLTDRLRVAGFKAFTHTVKSGDKERVHVYVGPEFKQASAVKLSTRVAQNIKMQGIVVKYNPLAL